MKKTPQRWVGPVHSAAIIKAKLNRLNRAVKETAKFVVLAQVESKTTKEKYYDIRLSGNNTVYCVCRGFQYRNQCDHLKRFRSDMETRRGMVVLPWRTA